MNGTGAAAEVRRNALRVAVDAKRAEPSLAKRIVVVGGGRMGDIRAANIARNPSASLVGFVDVDPERAAHYGVRYGCEAFVSLEDALASGAVDGVWVCAPTPYHVPLITTAARGGAHVAIEKPVAMTSGEIHAAYEVCEEHGVHLLCAFQRRTDEAYVALAAAVARGDVGALRSVRCVFRDHPVPSKAFLLAGGGDPFHDLATHDLDFILSLVGGVAPDEVYAVGSSLDSEMREAGVHDAATLVLKWAELQVVATVEVARASAYGYDQRCEVWGANGAALKIENPAKSNLSHLSVAGDLESTHVHSFPERFAQAFESDLQLFLDCCAGLAHPPVSKHDAARATEVAEAALQSALTGLPVRLGPTT